MKKNKFKQLLILVTCIIPLTILVGCGSNLFGDEESAANLDSDFNNAATNSEKVAVLDSALANATTVEEYNAIIEKVNQILSDENASDADKVGANLVKGESVLGSESINSVEIIQEVKTTIDTDGDSGNILNAITFSDTVTIEDLALSADSYNNADSIAESSVSSRISNSIALSAVTITIDENKQLGRFLANALLSLKIIQFTFDVADDGELTPKDETNSAFENIKNLITPPIDGGLLSKGLDFYGAKAIDAAAKSGSFTTEQLADLDVIETAGLLIYHMYQASDVALSHGGQLVEYRLLVNGNAVTLNTGNSKNSYSFNGLTTTARDTLLDTALEDAFKDLTDYPESVLEVTLNGSVIDADAHLSE